MSGIHDLGCIGECMNLERLDLSGNNITNLGPLAFLRLLSVLNLSANRISNLGKISGAGKKRTLFLIQAPFEIYFCFCIPRALAQL